MSQLPRKWSTGLGAVFLLGMAVTTVLPYPLAVSVMDRYDANAMLERTGVLLTLVIAIHLVACMVLAVLGFIAIKGRAVSASFTLAIVCAPLMLGLILGRIEMGSAGAHALALSIEARPGEIAHALAYTAAPLLAGLFATVSLLFAFCWSALIAHLALHKKGVGGSAGFFVAASWVPAFAALAAIFVVGVVNRLSDPPLYSLSVWAGVLLVTLAVPFALPASKGLKTYAERAPAEAAQRRLLIVVWSLPLSVVLLAFAHALQVLGEGLEKVQHGGGAAMVTQAEHQISQSLPWAAVNVALALVAVAPLFFTGGTWRRLPSPRGFDRLALIVIAVVTLGALWFEQGRYALLGLAREKDEAAQRFEAIGLPKGEGNAPAGSGPLLRAEGGELKWDSGNGQLSALENAKLDGLSSLRLAVPAKTSFSTLSPVLARLSKDKPLGFRLLEQRIPRAGSTEPLSSLAQALDTGHDGVGALAFRFASSVSPQELAALAGAEVEPPHSAVKLTREGDGWSATTLPFEGEGQAESWMLRTSDPANEGLRALRGRLDESPWVVVALGPDETAQSLAELGEELGRSNAIELVLTPLSK